MRVFPRWLFAGQKSRTLVSRGMLPSGSAGELGSDAGDLACVGSVRRALQDAGFSVEKRPWICG